MAGRTYCDIHHVDIARPEKGCEICNDDTMVATVDQFRAGIPRRLVGGDRNSPMALPCLRPKTSAERKAEPIHSGALMYFPDAIAAVARLSKKANEKHNPGEPMGWSRHKSNDHQDCAIRHSLTPEIVDAETGEMEAVAEAWRALANLQLLEERRLWSAGIMPYSGVTA